MSFITFKRVKKYHGESNAENESYSFQNEIPQSNCRSDPMNLTGIFKTLTLYNYNFPWYVSIYAWYIGN